MKPIITTLDPSQRLQLQWEYGEHSGTITFPSDERGPVKIEWDGDCPEEWEEIEDAVKDAAAEQQQSPASGHDAPHLVLLSLSPKQADVLAEVLLTATDEGPENGGWASPELQELRGVVDDSISTFKASLNQGTAEADCPPTTRSPVAILREHGGCDHLEFQPHGYDFPIMLPVITSGSRDKTGAWTWNGDIEKPTLRPSIKTTHGGSGKISHLWLNDGVCQHLDDSTDGLAGKTLPLQILEDTSVNPSYEPPTNEDHDRKH